MVDTMTSWFSVSDALTRVAVMVCVVCVTGGQLGAAQGPVKTYSFEGVESIRVVQCDGVGNDVRGVKIYEGARESKDLVIAEEKDSRLICTTNSSFTACTVQRGDFSKNISVRVIITDLQPGEVREYTCRINRETGDGTGPTAPHYHYTHVTRPAADQGSATFAYITGRVVAAVVVPVAVVIVVILVKRCKEPVDEFLDSFNADSTQDNGSQQFKSEPQKEKNTDTGHNDNETVGQPAPSTSHGQGPQQYKSVPQKEKNTDTGHNDDETVEQPAPSTSHGQGSSQRQGSGPWFNISGGNVYIYNPVEGGGTPQARICDRSEQSTPDNGPQQYKSVPQKEKNTDTGHNDDETVGQPAPSTSHGQGSSQRQGSGQWMESQGGKVYVYPVEGGEPVDVSLDSSEDSEPVDVSLDSSEDSGTPWAEICNRSEQSTPVNGSARQSDLSYCRRFDPYLGTQQAKVCDRSEQSTPVNGSARQSSLSHSGLFYPHSGSTRQFSLSHSGLFYPHSGTPQAKICDRSEQSTPDNGSARQASLSHSGLFYPHSGYFDEDRFNS